MDGEQTVEEAATAAEIAAALREISPIKGGWAAYGDGWAVHGETKRQALILFGLALERHKQIMLQPPAYQAVGR